MNFELDMRRIMMTTGAAERLYRIAFTIPPQASNHPMPWSLYTIKLPVLTTLNNAQLLLDIIQITPAMLRTEFYKLVEPKLHLLIKEWERLPKNLSLLNTYMYPVARMALVNVALLIHVSFPTVGQPQDVMARPAFSCRNLRIYKRVNNKQYWDKGLTKQEQNLVGTCTNISSSLMRTCYIK